MGSYSFPFGPFEFYLGSLLVFVGIVAAMTMLVRTVRDEEVHLSFLADHLLLLTAVPILFGRIGSFSEQWPALSYQLTGTFFANAKAVLLSFFLFGDGGLSIDWMMFGVIVTFLGVAAWRRQNMMRWLDAFTLPLLTLGLFVSLGAYFSGWLYGKPAPEWLPWPLSVEYDLLAVRYAGKIFATQLYLAALCAVLLLVGWQLWQHKAWQRWAAGRFFMRIVIGWGLGSGLIDFLRGDVALTSYANLDFWLIFKPLQWVLILIVDIMGLTVLQFLSFAIVFVAMVYLTMQSHVAIPRSVRK